MEDWISRPTKPTCSHFYCHRIRSASAASPSLPAVHVFLISSSLRVVGVFSQLDTRWTPMRLSREREQLLQHRWVLRREARPVVFRCGQVSEKAGKSWDCRKAGGGGHYFSISTAAGQHESLTHNPGVFSVLQRF